MCCAMNSTPFNAFDTLTFEEPPGAMPGCSNVSGFAAFVSKSNAFSAVAKVIKNRRVFYVIDINK